MVVEGGPWRYSSTNQEVEGDCSLFPSRPEKEQCCGMMGYLKVLLVCLVAMSDIKHCAPSDIPGFGHTHQQPSVWKHMVGHCWK